MKISGFTIARQAIRLDYPLVESIRSLLPIVDEYIVGIGDGDDGTWEAVAGIGDQRIVMFRSTWDTSPRDGQVLSEETNKALRRCTGDWAVYLQADEVLHEQDLPLLRSQLEQLHPGPVEALTFRYHHFYGSYDFVQDHPGRWYRRATRAIKNHRGIRSSGDGCAFDRWDAGRAYRTQRVHSPVRVFHYGWARRPEVMLAKVKGSDRFYHDDTWLSDHRPYPTDPRRVYASLGHLRHFTGDHPAVMRERIASATWTFDSGITRQPPDWIRRPLVYGSWLLREALARATRWARRR